MISCSQGQIGVIPTFLVFFCHSNSSFIIVMIYLFLKINFIFWKVSLVKSKGAFIYLL